MQLLYYAVKCDLDLKQPHFGYLQCKETVSVKVTIERDGDTLVAMAEDRVDGTNASEFQQALEAAISDADRIVILDCDQLSYISSAGLRVILLTARALQRQNSKFAVCSLSEQIREVFEISGFDKIIPVHATRADALGALSS